MTTALARLRAKTDQDLSTLIARQINRSLAEACRRNYQDAERGYESVRTWLALAELPPTKRDKLERKLAELRSHLTRPAGAVA